MTLSVIASCSPRGGELAGERFSYDWKAVSMDASRTGVSAVVGKTVDEALGVVDSCSVYTSPSGKLFPANSATAKAAAALISYQDIMAPLRVVIAHSAAEMRRGEINSPIYGWTADALKAGVEQKLGKKVDAAIMNKGGIRIDMPQGEVTVDDISSMFPFLNYLTYIEMPGYEVRKLLEFFADGHFQAISGIEMSVKDGKLVQASIGGRELDDKAYYRIASVDYLLDGGDHIYLARNARKLIISEWRMLDWMKEYAASLTADGKLIECNDNQRVVLL